MIKLGIVGCGGRMGSFLLAEAAQSDGVTLVGGADTAADIVGRDLGALAGSAPLGLFAEPAVDGFIDTADVLIDFSVPTATALLAARAAAAGVALVIGTTGLGDSDLAAVHDASIEIPIVMAANFSIGVNLLLSLVTSAARVLGPSYDVEIAEMHHRRKVDAPSGTALALGEAAAEGRGVDLGSLRLPARDGLTGPRPAGGIGFASLRGGDVVGDHTVIFATDGERIELTHRASDRRIFATGAVRAARWVAGRPAGLYGMGEVLAQPG